MNPASYSIKHEAKDMQFDTLKPQCRLQKNTVSSILCVVQLSTTCLSASKCEHALGQSTSNILQTGEEVTENIDISQIEDISYCT